MPELHGNHVQPSSERRFHYWVIYEATGDDKVVFACAISEPSKGMFGSLEHGSSLEGTVPVGPDFAPIDLAIRARVLGHIERTDFGQWRPPPPSWIGWYGPL